MNKHPSDPPASPIGPGTATSETVSDMLNPHVRVWGLIPWVVNGRATAAENQAVEAHVGDCTECRREYHFQRELHAAMRDSMQADDALPAPADSVSAQVAFNALLQRIDTVPARSAPPPTPASREPAPRRRWRDAGRHALIAAVCVQAFAIAWLAGRLQLQALAPYSTLSAPAVSMAPGAVVQLIVAPEMPAGELQALLQHARLQIVGGPSAAGVLALAPYGEPQPIGDVLAVLRAAPQVRLAEPVAGGLP